MANTQPGAVAQRVLEAKRRLRVPQAALAETLGLSQQAVSRRLVGKVAITVDEAEQLAGALGVSPAWLLLGDPAAAPELETV